MTEIDIVRAFLRALEEFEIDRALELCSDEIVYQNVPLPPARGKPEVAKQLRVMAKYGTGFEAHNHHIAANGSIVLTERTDVLRRGDWSAEFWVCGTFEVVDGRITLWRDRFDWATVLGSGLKGAARAAIGAVSRRVNR